ncbi:MAG: disulfide bond formation protein B [Sutterella wadsworthensis]
MKGFCESFRKSPMTAFADWQETREPWILFGVTSIILVLLAHYLFQGWLYMLPCEQCVYIRYGNIVMAIGAFLITINPKQALLKIAGIGVFLYGLIYTMICSGSSWASMTPSTPTTRWPCSACRAARRSRLITFGLPLDKWAPDWFKQTGDCGYDAPVVPDGTQLGDFQRWLIEVYQASDGWYLFPQWKFMDMA